MQTDTISSTVMIRRGLVSSVKRMTMMILTKTKMRMKTTKPLLLKPPKLSFLLTLELLCWTKSLPTNPIYFVASFTQTFTVYQTPYRGGTPFAQPCSRSCESPPDFLTSHVFVQSRLVAEGLWKGSRALREGRTNKRPAPKAPVFYSL